MEGFLLIDKPVGPTSHDIVDSVRRILRSQKSNYSLPITHYPLPKVGHAGTLDPFASGLLIIGIGKATKEMSKLVGLDKEYEALLKLGAISDTYDRTGLIKASGIKCQASREGIEEILKKFTGSIQQIPPMFSAKKVKGKKLYELARKGIEIERKPITITIYSLELLSIQKLQTTHYQLQTKIHCSSGTYIRSLAHDIGQALGCGAYLEELRRTAIGPFRIEEATPISAITSKNIEQLAFSSEKILSRISDFPIALNTANFD
ncbi:MAG: tRNA pseudouridine(55) synthase TruB [bacterium]|nr:tRNA pseudouridine(55) synthase TruB [bacterium]